MATTMSSKTPLLVLRKFRLIQQGWWS